ncbi:uncharacterized protein H6S33_006448 [Morchella sextelata]|uniref:uncharacterized protein n=1 Tax=Morchella sextelata TaxID=1174677 RepID=UPI001D03F9C6|nr:uncharacterized protein H6S33_006448 [Morchella sextelata]KAH0604780.1 hypothetical protein H6S33_006448 [Morchella sextelata]
MVIQVRERSDDVRTRMKYRAPNGTCGYLLRGVVKEREKEKREGEKERKGLAGGKKGTTSRDCSAGRCSLASGWTKYVM